MKRIIQFKWIILVSWIVATAILFFSAPNMAELVREKGQLEVPDGYTSTQAQEILKEINDQKGLGDTTSVALVFYNPDGLNNDDFKEAKQAVQVLEEKSEELGITDILTHFNQEELEGNLVSKDGKAILVSLTIDWKNRVASELSEDLYSALENINLEHYYTGNELIQEDVVLTAEEGVKKTEIITVVFILIVLIAVFRSIITPFIPLITVGVSYLASASIVQFLVEYVNFPLSNFTQIFLVAVLFGIGTDYSILLLSRYKEELQAQETVTDAVIETFRHAGKTVLFSGIAVLVGFAVIGLSQFKLYQSAAAVAVGIAVLLLALFTIVPFFMSILGKKLFWPTKGSLEHKPSKLWNFAGRFSFARPLVALFIVAIITIPFMITHSGKLSYDSMSEIGDDYKTVKAFEIIENSFGPGEAMSTTIVIKNDEEMDSIEYLNLMEKISIELEKVENVSTVRSLTRPTGEKLEEIQIAKQVELVKDGLQEGNDGIKQIRDGLSEATTELVESKPQLTEATKGISSLISGTKELNKGILELKSGLEQIESGVREGSIGADQAKAGLEEIQRNAETLLENYLKLEEGYSEIQSNLAFMHTNYTNISSGLGELNSQLGNLKNAFLYLEGYLNNQEVSVEQQTALQSFQGIKKYFTALEENLPVLKSGLDELNNGLGVIVVKLDEANSGLKSLNDGQSQLIGAFDQVISGLGELATGLEAAADGQGTIIGKLPEVSGGISKIGEGTEQLYAGFASLGDQLDLLTDGLDQSVDGLTQVHDGFKDAEEFLDALASQEEAGFYIPVEILENEQFEQVLDTYLSPDNKIAKIDVILNKNPYATESILNVDELSEAVKRAVQDTKLENATVEIGGVTSTFHDLANMSDEDFSKTVILMLIGIGIVLIILFRSLIMPIYIIASLLITYLTTMGITEFIFINLLGLEGLNWAVPFFSFVILISLGVDYSIFLMGRFNEYRGEEVEASMIKSMSVMGTVIISAVIILGGTFAAMLPSGVLSLLQIATVVITGLILYSLVMLPLFVPVMVKTFGKANWWPFFIDKDK